MLRFITCDNEPEALERTVLAIRTIMMPYDFDYKISKFLKYDKDFEEIIKTPGEQKVYLLDIDLPKVSGLEIASEIRENGDWESMIIFVSGHPECKDDIFYSRLLAIDYIAKDRFWASRFESTIEHVIKNSNKRS